MARPTTMDSLFRFSEGGQPPPNIFNFSPAFSPTQTQQQQQNKNTPQTRQIHRNRISYSCHACRRRKVKCDRQHPVCSNCTKTADICVYDDHVVKGSKGNKEEKAQKAGGGGTKRRRTNEGISVNEEGGDEASSSSSTTGNGLAAAALRTAPLDAGKQVDLETRMNRLAEIVDRWYKDASAQGIVPDGLGPRSGGAQSAVNELTENGFAQSQHYLDWLQKSTGPVRRGSGSASASASASPSPRNSTTPGSSIGGCPEAGAEPLIDGISRNGQLTLKIINAGIEAAKCSGNDDEVDDLGIGHLSIQGGGRTRYVGSSFWGLLSSEINELNTILKTHNFLERRPGDCPQGGHEQHPPSNSSGSPTSSSDASSSPAPPPAPTAHNPFPPSCPGGGLLPFPGSCAGSGVLGLVNKTTFLQFEPRGTEDRTCDLIQGVLKQLPPPSLAHTLYKSFLHGVHPVMPLIHVPTFDKQYKAFWEWYPENAHECPSAELIEQPTFLPLLFAVFYAGAISASSKAITAFTNGTETKEALTSRLYVSTMSALAACAFPRSPTVNSLISFLIVQTCLIREEEPLTSCSFVGMAMRVAQSMGLHRDGSLFNLSEIECEVRRRVWWHIMYLDVQGAIATGLPPLGGSNGDLYDTKMVSELKDEYIGLPPGAPEPVTEMSPHMPRCQEFYKDKLDLRTSPAMILAAGRYESTILLRVIITRLFAINKNRKSDLMEMGKMIYELKAKLEARISRIPTRGIPEMGFMPPGVEPGEAGEEVKREVVFNSWARIMLSLFSDRAFGVLYQPFLKSAKSIMWKHSRPCALHVCHSFLRKFLHLSCTSLFQPYQWFCPGTYQPLHSTMLLLLDLHERPFTPEAPKSRNFVDQVFAVFGETGNYSTGDGEGGNRPLQEGGREAWRMLWRLRKKAYEKAGVKIPEGAGGKREENVETAPAPAPAAVEAIAELVGACEGTDPPPHPLQYAMGSVPSPAQTPAPAAATPPTQGGFEELLQMDTIIDAEDKAFFTDAIMAHFLGGQQEGVDRMLESLGMGKKPVGVVGDHEEAVDQVPHAQETPFVALAEGIEGMGGVAPEGGRETQDMMDFDWEEWDQVFGKYVSVDVGDGEVL